MTCLKCQHGVAKRFGTYGRRRIQRYRCRSCKATFAAPQDKPLGRHTIEVSKAAHIVSLLMEGMSIRAVARLTGVHKNTIMALLITVGQKCERIFDRHIRNMRPRYIQADELWTFVHTKQGHLNPVDPREWGDSYVWMAIDAETKLVLSFYVGKRDAESCFEFVRDLSERITGRTQITTDGLKTYVEAIEQYFGADISFAQLLKLYGDGGADAPDWYAPSHVKAVIPIAISGNPDPKHICTSHVERANLSVRTHLRRFTRLSLGFSKKLDNLRAAVALYMAWFNLCRVHQTLRVTPAMQAGLSDHIWTPQELLEAA